MQKNYPEWHLRQAEGRHVHHYPVLYFSALSAITCHYMTTTMAAIITKLFLSLPPFHCQVANSNAACTSIASDDTDTAMLSHADVSFKYSVTNNSWVSNTSVCMVQQGDAKHTNTFPAPVLCSNYFSKLHQVTQRVTRNKLLSR